MNLITLDGYNYQQCLQMALQRASTYKGQTGWYENNNALRSHCVGAIGEMAVHLWLTNNGIKNSITNDDRCPDIITGNCLELETKCWRECDWEGLGRAIKPYHAQKYMRNATPFVIFTHITNASHNLECLEGVIVSIDGWNTPSEIISQPVIKMGKGIDNHQMSMESMHKMPDLIQLIKSGGK